MDMVIRSWSSSTRQILFDLLNETNSEVIEAHESAGGKALELKTIDEYSTSENVRILILTVTFN